MRLNCRTFSTNTTSLSSSASTYNRIAINSGNNVNSEHSYCQCAQMKKRRKKFIRLSYRIASEWKRNCSISHQHTWDQPFDKKSPPNRALANIVCTILSWDRSMRPSCFTSNAHNGIAHSSQSSIVSHCLPLKTFRDTFMHAFASSPFPSMPSVFSASGTVDGCCCCSWALAWHSNQSKYLIKLWNFTFWCGLQNESNRKFKMKTIVKNSKSNSLEKKKTHFNHLLI